MVLEALQRFKALQQKQVRHAKRLLDGVIQATLESAQTRGAVEEVALAEVGVLLAAVEVLAAHARAIIQGSVLASQGLGPRSHRHHLAQKHVASSRPHSLIVGYLQTASPISLIGREKLAGHPPMEQAPAKQAQARTTFSLRHRGQGVMVTLQFSPQATLQCRARVHS